MSFDKQNDDILVSLARSRARADKIYKNIARVCAISLTLLRKFVMFARNILIATGINFSLIETRVSKP